MLQRDTTEPQVTRPRPRNRYIRRAATHLTAADRRTLGLWTGAHLALAILAWMATWISGTRAAGRPLLGTYEQWDALWYAHIAQYGYFSGHFHGPSVFAFFPGTPAALAVVHLLVWNWALAGLLVSFFAGGVAMVCIGRLGGERAALYLLTAPAAMYLMVGYSEALFLALALPAWMAARRRDWPLAGLLAALAGLVRVDGLFLTAALLVAAVTSERGTRLRAAAWSSIALLGPALFEAYLWAGSGSPTAYLAANRVWGLHFTWPWRAWINTWHMAFGPDALPPNRAAMFQLEIVCLVAAAALTAVLAWRRAWPEAVYCGLAVIALGTTTYYQSTPRALLIMWPLYVLVARAAERRPWVGHVYLWVCAPLAALVAVYFFLNLWAV